MTWVIVAIVAVAALPFLFSKGKTVSGGGATPVSSGSPIEDSRRKLAALVLQNRNRALSLSGNEASEMISALRRDADTYWNHGYDSAIRDGKGEKFATQVGLFGVAAAILTGEQHPDPSLNGGLDLETVPFKELPPKEAKAAFIEYCVVKYIPAKAEMGKLVPELLKFADKVFEEAKTHPNPDEYIYEMIYRETLDWQRVLAEALSKRNKAIA